MTKKYYQTLGVGEKATPEDIKKSYYKLAQQWHPDKWNNKSFEERKQANKMMQEINKAYEILSDAEKRKRYDLGLTDFPTDDFDFQYDPKEEVRKQEEELRRKEVQIIDLELEILKLEMKALDRQSTITEISAVFCFTWPRVHAEDLNPGLWQPYQRWGEKVVKMEITIPKGKDYSEELKQFKKEMKRAIKEVEATLKIKEENKKKNEHDSELNQAREAAFGYIEKEMNYKSLKDQDLGEYANYQEKINGLSEVWDIRNFREEVLGFISKLVKKEPEKRDNYYSLNNPYPPRGQIDYRSPNDPNFLGYNPRPRENPDYQPWSIS